MMGMMGRMGPMGMGGMGPMMGMPGMMPGMMRGMMPGFFPRMIRTMQFRGGRGRGQNYIPPVPVGPPEEIEPSEHCPIESISSKQVDNGAVFYMVHWKDSEDQKESGWVNRNQLYGDGKCRGAVNQYEVEFLEEIKEVIKNTVEDTNEVILISTLERKLKSEYPEFVWSHLPRQFYAKFRNITMLLKSIEGFKVKEGHRGTVATAAALEKKREEEMMKQEELREAFATLIELVMQRGGKTELSYVSGVFTNFCPNFDREKYGFMRFKEFILACPGIYMDPAPRQQPIPIELKDPCPPELKDILERRRTAAKELMETQKRQSQVPSSFGRRQRSPEPRRVRSSRSYRPRSRSRSRSRSRRRSSRRSSRRRKRSNSRSRY